jgi:hypothetical protein
MLRVCASSHCYRRSGTFGGTTAAKDDTVGLRFLCKDHASSWGVSFVILKDGLETH